MRPPTHAEQETPAPSVLVEELLEVLEKHGVPTGLSDTIVDMIEIWEETDDQGADAGRT